MSCDRLEFIDDRVRSQRLELTSSGPKMTGTLLDVTFQRDGWRIVEGFSEKGRPFELTLRWSTANATGTWVKVTVAHAARICVFARSLLLDVVNLSNQAHSVIGRVADGFSQTANVWEHRATSVGGKPLSLPIPPFAAAFHLHLAERDALPGTVISLLDGTEKVRARFSAANQPPGGILVGGAGRLEVLTQKEIDLRGIFTLSL